MVIKPRMDISEMISRLSFHEGCVLMPYICPAGKLTIGIGRNIDDNAFTAEEKKAVGDWRHGITKEMAYMLCRNDIARCKEECQKGIPFFDNLDIERQYALIDLCFNMGIKALKRFKKMLEALGCGNYDRAADELLNSKYATQVGTRAKRIAIIIRDGRWQQWI